MMTMDAKEMSGSSCRQAHAALGKASKRLLREEMRLQKIDSQLAALMQMWTVTQKDVQAARQQHAQYDTLETKRHLQLVGSQEKLAQWKVAERARTKEEIVATIVALRAECEASRRQLAQCPNPATAS